MWLYRCLQDDVWSESHSSLDFKVFRTDNIHIYETHINISKESYTVLMCQKFFAPSSTKVSFHTKNIAETNADQIWSPYHME